MGLVMQNRLLIIIIMLIMILASSETRVLSASTDLPKIHVYNDGSVFIEYSEARDIKDSGHMIFCYLLDIDENSYYNKINIILRTGFSCKAGLNCTYMTMITNGSGKRYDDYYEYNAKINISVYDDVRGIINISFDKFIYKIDMRSLSGSLGGELDLRASGEFRKIFLSQTLLNMLIRGFMSQRDISWIKINNLSTQISGDMIKIKYDLEINFERIIERTGLNISDVKELLRNFSSREDKIYIFYNVSHIIIEMYVRIDSDINKSLREDIAYLYNIQKIFRTKILELIDHKLNISTEPIYKKDSVEKIMSLSRDLVNMLRILNSKAELKIELKDGLIKINATSPRIINRESKSPKDTLMTLYILASKADEIFKNIDLLNKEVELVPEAGVKILRNGTEVERIKLREIPDLDVVSTSSQTATTQIISATIIITVIVLIFITIFRQRSFRKISL
jgi:hypothetical protein